jgi:N-acyl homoserine lactone hydrolase
MRPQQSTAEIIEAEAAPLKGVFMAHLHLDHVSGFPDIPNDVPVYTGAHEAEASLFLNLIAQRTNNHLLDGRPALQELQFTNDPDGTFDGVNDVFGDGSFFAILTPRHTAGHTSYLARTTAGPVLLTGDTSHTRWGWENDVEPGSFLAERQRSRNSLHALKALSQRHPDMTVKLGHQPEPRHTAISRGRACRNAGTPSRGTRIAAARASDSRRHQGHPRAQLRKLAPWTRTGQIRSVPGALRA